MALPFAVAAGKPLLGFLITKLAAIQELDVNDSVAELARVTETPVVRRTEARLGDFVPIPPLGDPVQFTDRRA